MWSEALCALMASRLLSFLYVGLSASDPPSVARVEAVQLPMGFKAQYECHGSLFTLAARRVLDLL